MGLFLLYSARVSTYEASQSESHNRFVYLLINILVKIAQADGHFSRAELNAILNFFQYHLRYNQDQMYWVKQLTKEARDNTTDLRQLLEEFRTSFAYEPRLILLELIYQIIHTKQPPPENELRLAREAAQLLQISVYDQRTIEAKYMYRQRQEAASAASQEEQYYACSASKRALILPRSRRPTASCRCSTTRTRSAIWGGVQKGLRENEGNQCGLRLF